MMRFKKMEFDKELEKKLPLDLQLWKKFVENEKNRN